MFGSFESHYFTFQILGGVVVARCLLSNLSDEENIDPVGIYILRRAYGLRLDLIAEQVEAVAHPQVGMCLDVGHGYLASCYLGWDYLATIRQVAPLVEPNAGIVLGRSCAGHRLAARNRGPIRRLLVLRGSGCRQSKQQRGRDEPSHQAPVRIRSTSCFTVGTKPFE